MHPPAYGSLRLLLCYYWVVEAPAGVRRTSICLESCVLRTRRKAAARRDLSPISHPLSDKHSDRQRSQRIACFASSSWTKTRHYFTSMHVQVRTRTYRYTSRTYQVLRVHLRCVPVRREEAIDLSHSLLSQPLMGKDTGLTFSYWYTTFGFVSFPFS